EYATGEPISEMIQTTSLEDKESTKLKKFSLSQNYPNPFNPTTTIEFSLPHASPQGQARITLHVYDTAGRKVKTLIDGSFPAGNHNVQWNGTNDAGQPVGSGVYFYRLQAGNYTAERKMLLVR
ncbi:MAG: T9SS C-terminal target domain-containing protein, partial [Calditrichaeota bacterium]